MSENTNNTQTRTTAHYIKYPGSFTYGFVSGCVVSMLARRAMWEPLCARPFGYLTVGFTFGMMFKYWDWHRRVAVEQVLMAEDDARYFNTLKGLNKARVGEEDELGNLTEYLSTSTVRA